MVEKLDGTEESSKDKFHKPKSPRPRTPEHNDKVERSHSINQDKLYSTLKFYSLDDLRKQEKVGTSDTMKHHDLFLNVRLQTK